MRSSSRATSTSGVSCGSTSTLVVRTSRSGTTRRSSCTSPSRAESCRRCRRARRPAPLRLTPPVSPAHALGRLREPVAHDPASPASGAPRAPRQSRTLQRATQGSRDWPPAGEAIGDRGVAKRPREGRFSVLVF